MEDWPAPAPPLHPIEQYWVLAFLLHVWVVLMFGTLQGGTAKPGEGVWGSLTVALVGPPGQGEASSNALENGALAPQAQARQGRAEAALPDAAVTAPQGPESGESVANGSVDAPGPAQPAALPQPDPPGAIDPPPQAAPPPDLPPPAPPTPAMAEPLPAQAATAVPQPVAAAPDLPVAPLPPEVVGVVEDVAKARPEATNATLASAVPALALPRPGQALVAAAAARSVPELARPLQRVPAAARAPVPVASAVAVAQASPPVPPVPATPAPALAVAPASAPLPAAPPPVLMRLIAADAMPAAARGPAFNAALTPARSVVRPPEVSRLAEADRVGPARRPVVQGQPDATTAAAPAASGVALGATTAQAGAVAAPAPAASSARLILELPRGGAMAAQGVRGAVQWVPPPPERKSKLGEALDKAAKTDCREAYQKNGLLAVVPLVVDAVRDKGCQW